MKVFGEYLRKHTKFIIVFLFTIIIFITVFYLYNIRLEPVVYAAVLSFMLIFVLSAFDFFRFYKRHKELVRAKKRILCDLGELPEPRELIETDYNDLLHYVYEDKIEQISARDIEKQEIIEYYTLWAHQIKIPISAMRLLLQSSQNEENEEIYLELFKIEQYVEMVLQYLKIDSISSDMILEEYELSKIARQAVRKYAKMFINKNITMNFIPFECKAITDEKWLQFVIEQVISNALKYTKKGSVTIRLDETDNRTLIVEDTGIGIRQEDIPRIFERGFTGYNGRLDKKSTGIGLYMCKKIMNKLSHSMVIESEIDKGTIVKLKI